MTDARTEILQRVRSSLGAATSEPAPIAREYRASGSLDVSARIELLIDRLEEYDATVTRVPETDISRAVADFLHDASTIVLPEALPAGWLERVGEDVEGGEPPEVVRDSAEHPIDMATIDTVDAVVTGSFVSIADTGTIVLVGAESGRRVTTLVPDHHVIVVRAADIVEIVPEGIRRIVDAGLDTDPITMVSGPSATVDIEFIRVHGVHGPRRLDVVIAE